MLPTGYVNEVFSGYNAAVYSFRIDVFQIMGTKMKCILQAVFCDHILLSAEPF